jgi:CHASE3 domain sensor protein
MRLSRMKPTAVLTTCASFLMLTAPPPVLAEGHVVPLAELQGKLNSQTQTRSQNITDIGRVLSLPAAQEAMQKAKINVEQARNAIAQLNDAELSRLADRARAAEADVQGGLIVGLLALIGLIVVIIIVVSIVA